MGCGASKVSAAPSASSSRKVAYASSGGAGAGGAGAGVSQTASAKRTSFDATKARHGSWTTSSTHGPARLEGDTGSGPIMVHTPVPHTLSGFAEFGEDNVWVCLEYLYQLVQSSATETATVDVPAHRLSAPYAVHHHADPHSGDVGLHNLVVPDVKAEVVFLHREYAKLRGSEERKEGSKALVKRARVQTLGSVDEVDHIHAPVHGDVSEEAIHLRAHCLCEVHRDTLNVAHIAFTRPLDEKVVADLVGEPPLSRAQMVGLCAAFAEANTSHSGHLTRRQLASYVQRRSGSIAAMAVDGPAMATPKGGSLLESVTFMQALRLAPPPHEDGMKPEEWCALAHHVRTMSRRDLETFIFQCMSTRIYRLRNPAEGPEAGGLALAAAAAARHAGVESELHDRAIRINTIRDRFPQLRSARTNHHRANIALLRALTRVYHARLGTFSEDELKADGVLCKMDDWFEAVETEDDVMSPVMQLKQALRESTAGSGWEKRTRSMRKLLTERRKPYPEKQGHHASEVIQLVPMNKPAPHRRISALAATDHLNPDAVRPSARAVQRMMNRRHSNAAGGTGRYRPRRSSNLAPKSQRRSALASSSSRRPHIDTGAGAGAGSGASYHGVFPASLQALVSPSRIRRLDGPEPRLSADGNSRMVKRPSFVRSASQQEMMAARMARASSAASIVSHASAASGLVMPELRE